MLPPRYADASPQELDEVINKASSCFFEFRKKSAKQRANFLTLIASEIENLQSVLLETAQLETNLGFQRLETELIRTINQIKEFSQLAKRESWKDFSHEKEDRDRLPLPKPSMFRENIPIGPVAVIGACNFPFAISVVGTDSSSALAVGCPVIVKSHPKHPKTSELQKNAVRVAIQKADMPEGCFSLIHGEDHSVTKQLVSHPKICCVAFTGSEQGGTTLGKIVAERPKPIPFHAEMGSLNPIFALPSALSDNSEIFAQGYVDAVNLFAGQMCTKPGALVILAKSFDEKFKKYLSSKITSHKCLPMLNEDVYRNFNNSMACLEGQLNLLGKSEQSKETHILNGKIQIFQISAKKFLENQELRTESFGPSSLVVVAENFCEMLKIANNMEGSLTGTIHAAKGDASLVKKLLPVVTSKVGRIIWNGFPPGVIPGPATHHGGPWPATTDSRFTSIGIQGYKRFVRPVCNQGFPHLSSVP